MNLLFGHQSISTRRYGLKGENHGRPHRQSLRQGTRRAGTALVEMGGIAEKMVVDAMDALANADATLAHQVVTTDPRLDALQREIEEEAVLTITRRHPVANDLREIIGAIRIAGDLERVATSPKTSPGVRSRSV